MQGFFLFFLNLSQNETEAGEQAGEKNYRSYNKT